MTSDGQLYGLIRYKEICKERYLISKHSHTSYSDTENITPAERGYLMEFIMEDLQREQEIAQEQLSKQSNK